LRQLQEVGDHPRDFNVFADRWLVVGAMEGNKVEVYGWDHVNGIQNKNFELEFAKPVCIV